MGVTREYLVTDRNSKALMKTGAIAVLYYCALAYRYHARGELRSSKRVLLYGAAFMLVSFAVAMTWQATSQVKNCSWWMTFLGFTLSMVVVSVATVVVFRYLA